MIDNPCEIVYLLKMKSEIVHLNLKELNRVFTQSGGIKQIFTSINVNLRKIDFESLPHIK